jgi:hypothetical protein
MAIRRHPHELVARTPGTDGQAACQRFRPSDAGPHTIAVPARPAETPPTPPDGSRARPMHVITQPPERLEGTRMCPSGRPVEASA